MTLAAHLQMPSKLTGVIFDCDGVILDSRLANEVYYNKILKILALPPLTPEQEAYTYMATVQQALDFITPPELRHKLPDICRNVVNYRRDIMPLVRLEEGFLDFIKFLHAAGIRLAVHTNRSSGMPSILDTFGLHDYFNPVLTAAVVAAKPDPEGVFHVLEEWQVNASELLFIGDSENDKNTASAGGVPFVAYRNPALDAAVKVDTFKELMDILLQGPLKRLV